MSDSSSSSQQGLDLHALLGMIQEMGPALTTQVIRFEEDGLRLVNQPEAPPAAVPAEPASTEGTLRERVERLFRNDNDSDSDEDNRASKWFREFPFQDFNSAADIKELKKLLAKKNFKRTLEERTINFIIKIYETDQLMRADSQSFIKFLFSEIFGEADFLDWVTQNYQKHQTSFGFCQKATKGQKNFMYQCFDCFEGGEDTKKFVCADCFSNGNHRGHKTTRSFLGSICDCGSMQTVNGTSGNCTKHLGQFPDDTVMTKEKLQTIEEKLKRFVFLIFKIVEISSSFAAMKVLGELFGNIFCRPLNKLLYTFPSMIPMLSMMFVSPLHQVAGIDKHIPVELQHSHQDLHSGFLPLGKFEKCDCSIFELIFRYSLKFSIGCQRRFNQLAHRLISYRPFMVEIGGQWLKLYNKVARTKGESEERKPPLATIKHDIVVDAEIMIKSVKKYGLLHFVEQIFKNIESVIDEPKACFIPGLNTKLPSSINVLPSITKYPENCLEVLKNPQFIKNLYPAFFKIYEKVLGQGLRLRNDDKFLASDDLQIFLLRYQYDVYHSINQLIFGLKNNPLAAMEEPFFRNMQPTNLCFSKSCELVRLCSWLQLVAALMLSTYHKRLAEPIVLKSFEGFGPRSYLTFLVAWLCLDCSNPDAPRIEDIQESTLTIANARIKSRFQGTHTHSI